MEGGLASELEMDAGKSSYRIRRKELGWTMEITSYLLSDLI